MKCTLVLMSTPSGRWIFVGHVPAGLAYEQADGSDITEDQALAVRQFGPRLAGVRSRGYESEADASSAAEQTGHSITQIVR